MKSNMNFRAMKLESQGPQQLFFSSIFCPKVGLRVIHGGVVYTGIYGNQQFLL